MLDGEGIFFIEVTYRMTQKLFYDDLYAREFDAAITSCTEHDGKYTVILDRTLFYPGGGGQPCDLGTICGVDVVDVVEHGGEILHVMNALPETYRVHGVIDWPRRFEFMQQHLGEHIFAGCLHNLHGIHTQRMRIEGDNVSIDTAQPVNMRIILEAEAAANEAVYQDLPVEVIYPPLDEVKELARKLPPDDAIPPVRIVKIPGVDYVPCCGLHVSTTGQVGLVKITSCENHKGGTRIYLRCGRAAYRWVADVHNEVRKAESELVCGYDGINDKILSLKAQIHDLKAQNDTTTIHYLKPIAEKLIDDAESFGGYRVVRHVMKDSGQDEIKHMFRLLTENNNVVAFLAGVNEAGVFLTFGTGKGNKGVDVRGAFRTAIAMVEGRGGGSSFCAQGWGKNPGMLDEALEAAVSEVKNNIHEV